MVWCGRDIRCVSSSKTRILLRSIYTNVINSFCINTDMTFPFFATNVVWVWDIKIFLENLVLGQDDVIRNLFGLFLKWKHVTSYGDARMWHILSNHMTYFFIREWYKCARISGIVWLTTIDMTRGNLWRFEDIYINEGKRLWTRKLVERCKFYLP